MILSDLIRSHKYCNPFKIETTKHHEKKNIVNNASLQEMVV